MTSLIATLSVIVVLDVLLAAALCAAVMAVVWVCERNRGVAQQQSAGPITRMSAVRIRPPQP